VRQEVIRVKNPAIIFSPHFSFAILPRWALQLNLFNLIETVANFLYIFSAENHFPWNFPQNFLGKQFFKTFSAEKSYFHDIF
jgi:hypothetical protein